MTKFVSVAEAKAHLSEILSDVRERGAEVVVSRRGKPIAVIRAYRDEDAALAGNWLDPLYGALASDAEFEREMRAVVRSRKRAGARKVDLGV